MKLATAPVNWNSPDVPEYRTYTPYPQLLEEMMVAGYSATEWSSIMPKEPKVLAEDLRVRGLRMLGGFVGLDLRNPIKCEQEVLKGVEIGKYFQSLGASYLIAADSGDTRRVQEAGRVKPGGGLTDAQWESLGAGLNQLGTLLKPAGVRLVFHNHVGTYVETEAETCRLLDTTNAALVGWCLDCGHLTYGGGDTLRMLTKYGDRVGYVHIKDVDRELLRRSREEGWSFHEALKRFIFPRLGEGMVNIPAVIQALKDHHYDGWLVVEQDTTPLSPTTIAMENRLYLETLLRPKSQSVENA
jgi:inosose dehydratase